MARSDPEPNGICFSGARPDRALSAPLRTASGGGGQFAPVYVPRCSELVADQIRDQILNGELTEGDSLPSVERLMDRFGISRSTLRQAFRVLEAEGLISVPRGARTGVKIHNPSVQSVSRYAGYVLQSQGTTVADLRTARLATELFAIERLADRGSPGSLATLREIASKIGRDTGNQSAIEAFHLALAHSAGSRALTLMNQMLLDLERQYCFGKHQAGTGMQSGADHANGCPYEELLDLIETGSGEAAVAHWIQHLTNSADP